MAGQAPSDSSVHGVTSVSPGLPVQTRLGPVTLRVSDLDRSLDYYRQVLGLRTLGATSAEASLGAPESDEPLVRLKTVPGTHSGRRGAYGLFHFAILLPDRASLGRFVSHLAVNGIHAGMSDHLVSEAIYLSDPDGLGIEVYADRPRSQWTYVDGQPAMATDPLDVNDLVQAAQSRPWDGVPPGTAMGHMHLHVGDLREAEHFYHQLLGFDVTVRGYPGALFFSAGGYHHHLGTNTWAPGPKAAADRAQLREWTMVVPTRDDAATIGSRIATAGHEVEVVGDDRLVTDPWGTRVRITARAW